MAEERRVPGYDTDIEIVEHDPEWSERFEREAERIEDSVGDTVVRIEHVGSTSVPELPAKPIIDIGITISNTCCIRDQIESLESNGYQFGAERDDWLQFHRWDNGQQFNIGVCSHASDRWRRSLVFREYLRDHPDARDEYAAVKHEAAAEYPRDAPAYNDAKSATIKAIVHRARADGYDERI